MVKIGMLNLVRDIVASLSQQGRADVVAQAACCTFVCPLTGGTCFSLTEGLQSNLV